jgi:dTDP-4-dehydrorhamnose reductase
VNGESTLIDSPFHADDVPAPQDAYGVSKMEAE